MKKIICIAGEPGSGRKTLCNNIINNTNNVNELLSIDAQKVEIINEFDDPNIIHSDVRHHAKRIENIINKISIFMQDEEKDTLLLVSYFPDFIDNNCTFNKIAELFPTVSRKILFLNPSEFEVLYNRLTETEWYKSSPANRFKFTKEWLRFSSEYMKSKLMVYDEMGYGFEEVDTLDGYSIKRK